MTAQPAPVTPPPEWAVQAATEIACVLNDNQCLPGAFATCLSILLKHAPPPAPSDALTASEWSRLRDWFGNPQRKLSNLAFTAGAARDAASAFESSLTVADSAPSCPMDEMLIQRLTAVRNLLRHNADNDYAVPSIDAAIKALSRQPAPSADARSQTGEGERVTRLREMNQELGTRIAELEEENDRLCVKLGECRGELKDRTHELAQLRAAPSAVAKDRAEVVEKLKHWHVLWSNEHRGMEALPDIADAIALLSQPAVAQTEAGNDVRQH